MSLLLKRLKPQARKDITPDVWNLGALDLERHAEPYLRTINLQPLSDTLTYAVQKFENENPSHSDGWLASSVHATLRLQRWEAADQSLWDWLTLGVPEFRDYLKWRWAGAKNSRVEEQPLKGGSNRHAFARLWWAAELARDGADYTLVEQAFDPQNTADFLIGLNAFHNRPAALAWVKFLQTADNGNTASSNQIPRIGQRMNHALTTVMLDALAPDAGPDPDAIEVWLAEEPDVTLMEDNLPEGPNDSRVNPESLQRAQEFLKRLWDEGGLSPTAV